MITVGGGRYDALCVKLLQTMRAVDNNTGYYRNAPPVHHMALRSYAISLLFY